MITRKNIIIGALTAAAAALLVVTQTAASDPNYGQKKLGGAWVGGVGGIQWSAVYAPLDPAGRTATLQIQFPGYPAAIQAGLLAPFGADTVSVGVGEAAMTDRDTAKFTWVAYAVTDAHPPVIMAIFVVNGTMDFTGPDSAMTTETVRIYLPDADANHDGLPDSYDSPLATVPFPPGLNVRVPILQ